MNSALSLKNEKTSQILSDVRKRTKELAGKNLVKIILYGSYARNSQDNYSDMDIMILVDAEEENIKKYEDDFKDTIFELSLKYDILLSIIFKSNDQFNKYSEILPFYMNIDREGIELYG
jgi:uncharacterized protein